MFSSIQTRRSDSDGETLYNVTRATSVSVNDHIMGFLFYNDNKDSDGNYAISSQSMIVKFGSPLFSAMPPVSVKRTADVWTQLCEDYMEAERCSYRYYWL